MGLLTPKYKLEFYHFDNKVLMQGANSKGKLKAVAERAIRNKVCDKIVVYEYKGMFKEGYVIIDEGPKDAVLRRL